MTRSKRIKNNIAKIQEDNITNTLPADITNRAIIPSLIADGNIYAPENSTDRVIDPIGEYKKCSHNNNGDYISPIRLSTINKRYINAKSITFHDRKNYPAIKTLVLYGSNEDTLDLSKCNFIGRINGSRIKDGVTFNLPNNNIFFKYYLFNLDDINNNNGYNHCYWCEIEIEGVSTKYRKLDNPEAGTKRIDLGNSNTKKYVSLSGNCKLLDNANAIGEKALYLIQSEDSSKCIIESYFESSSLKIIGWQGSSSYSLNTKVFIDNIEVGIMEQTETIIAYRIVNFEINGLENKTHTLKIINDDNKNFLIDAIDIDENGYMMSKKNISGYNFII